ncbi:type VI secretion system protein TssA [Janthinobacterium sp. PC23-8]|uniref:type VI secretion system protein TssA n=1 Tax=Janthinobacterium sp. PC23-8 TaxID=2012679 RepID=UPI000B96E4A0|nr:type VI secretion system protein TssA [Janthinobacterium sp. PC23-8]OYO27943.1 type VI secretion system ImpA domain-containing protein [Janthinobacterium sp. PC23-8]
MDISHYAALGKQPVSTEQPSGADVREDDEFDRLQNEIAKMSNPAATDSVDWEQVVRLAASLTASKGKDLLVGCYLAGGLLQTSGLPGLLVGISLLDDMTALYWKTLYPPPARARARRNAVQWLLERIKVHGDESDWSSLPPQSPELIAELQTRLKSLDTLLAEKDPEAPSLRGVLSQLTTVAVQEVVAPPVAGAADEPASDLAHASEHSVAPAGLSNVAIDSIDAAQQAGADALQRLADMATYMGEADLAAPSAYRFKRMAAWGGIEQLPAEQGGATMLAGPIPQLQQALNSLLTLQADADLLRFTEAQLENYPFWLDLNCIAAQALERMGELYAPARREVSGATSWLLTRFPRISQLAFAGGMPMANGATLQWIDTLTGGASTAAPASDNTVASIIAQARAQAAGGELALAVRSVQKAITESATPTQRLQLRIQLCGLLQAERPGAHLQPLALALIAEIDEARLPQWDPVLTLAGLQAAYMVLATDDDRKGQCEALLQRIAMLDAGAMVALVT